ncbi:ATP-dependent zinc protease family protein [Marinicella gelatinilytica]|uniref:ATP-dependent zinc protease family protein n=1 Tax=Marinicella gelatinilytica TaxID=2996017 RepID=UPI002260F64D|nr:RimK/LysX family protein [Marinicella gelatinilytica]MCX7546015.1 RimK/LysX family protein [Marinicella gelatinilytica]
MTEQKQLTIGWKEWGALPELGIDHIHMKTDTGAKTSAIHTVDYALYEKHNEEWVRFVVAPIQDDDDTTVECHLPVQDKRTVTNSGGIKSHRIVVETLLQIGNSQRRIELTLACRRKMKFRMLLGRQAMSDILVKPDKAHLIKSKPLS